MSALVGGQRPVACGVKLPLATRKAVTKAQATRYRSGSRAVKSEILDLVCTVNGFNRDYARRAL